MKASACLTTFFFFFFLFEKLMTKKPKSNLNLNAMSNFIIKTHKPQTLYLSETLYILNKGLNSGKPLNQPCPNCFVLVFPDSEQRTSYYWLAYSLWKNNFWHPYLVGSVIPFLRINDFRNEFTRKTSFMIHEHEKHLNNIAALKILEQKEIKFQKDLRLIGEMRKVILHRYHN